MRCQIPLLLIRLFVASHLVTMCQHAEAAKRPNIVWIVSEDNSIHYLDRFFKGGAKTPHIDGLARSGLTFLHAFSNAPVCSVARTTLATGCYAPRIGAQFHRKYVRAPMPQGLKMFPAYLRAAGYYTSNNAKTDYNAIPSADVWDESSRRATWRKRTDPQQPFFHMESHHHSHESSLHFSPSNYRNQNTITNPRDILLAPYFPDTGLFRYTHARYHDRIATIDAIVGRTVARLHKDGLLEDTFVFYFGDHGGVLPRSKGYLYESGLHVPLVVRVPKNFRHLVDFKPGSRVSGFVNFIDFGPTVLRLAGIQIPKQMDGRAFLGAGVTAKNVEARRESFGYADRFDERYELVRSLRRGKYQYIRCYQPYIPDALQNNYRYKMLAYKEWRRMFRNGKLTGAAKQFFLPKPVELLFDVERDPHQIHNLAADSEHLATLRDLRRRLSRKLKQLPDLSFYPESHLARHAMNNPVRFGQQHKAEIGRLIDIADLATAPFKRVSGKLQEGLSDRNPMVRYWSLMVCNAFGKQAISLYPQIRKRLADREPIVTVRAAEFIGIVGKQNPQTILTRLVNTTDDPILATEVLNAVVLFRDFYGDRYPVNRGDFRPRSRGADIDDRLNYINGNPYPRKARQKKRRRKRETSRK